MAYACDRCSKGVLIGRQVSRSKQRSRKVSLPNLHTFRGILAGKKGKWRLCTKCLRTVKKEQKTQKELTTKKAIAEKVVKPAPKKSPAPKSA